MSAKGYRDRARPDEAGESGRNRPLKRGADDPTTRRLRFEAARRILFGVDIIPGTNREWWTTAGYLRNSSIAYGTPFTLGPFEFVIASGTTQQPRHYDRRIVSYDQRNEALDVMFSAFVFMRLPSPIPHGTKRRDWQDGLIVSDGEWLAIAILRSDSIIPITPNFLATTKFNMHKSPGGEHWYRPMDVSIFDGGRAILHADTQIAGSYEEKGWGADDDDDDEEEAYWLTRDVDFQWEQFGQKVGKRVYFESVFDEPFEEFTDLRVSYGTLNGQIDRSGYQATFSYQGRVPFEHFETIFPASMYQIDPDFVNALFSDTNAERRATSTEAHPGGKVPVRYQFASNMTGALTLRPVATTETGAWLASDMAHVAYAQSWLMHVLSGPDERHYIPTADPSPMKETQVPAPFFQFQFIEEWGVYDLTMVGAQFPGGQQTFVSPKSEMRFFTQRPRVRNLVASLQAFQARPNFLNMLHNPHWPETAEFLANFEQREIQKRELEFMGAKCNVCFKPEPSFDVDPVGISVCSHQCFNKAMNPHISK